jgi:RsiW-degrading membrane proteinase PrsW (M82 family)
MSAPSVLFFAVVLALLPTLLYALLLWWLDRYEKEPLPMLLVAFLWGAIPAILLALALEIAANAPLEQFIVESSTRRLAEAGFLAPIFEESVKALLLVFLFVFSWREFDNVLDGIIYGALVGLGFAFVENVLYLISAAYAAVPEGVEPDLNRMVQLWLLRAGLFGLNHSVFTAFTGAALGYAISLKRRWHRVSFLFLGLAIAVLLHSIHNSLITAVGVYGDDERYSDLVLGACMGAITADWSALLLILVVAGISSVREGHVIRETLWEEVALGRFTPDEYVTLASGRRRWNARWNALFSSGFKRWRQLGRFFDLATNLAFRKHRMYNVTAQHQTDCAHDIARLRLEIDKLKMAMIHNA